jgi:hydrogenase maturation protein HypF
MAGFPMCPACQAEYDDPGDRRYHAQPIACPACGPKIQLLSPDGTPMDGDAADVLLAGKILALKGLGGFQMLVDATDEGAVMRLRERKHREAKPLAVMFPDVDTLRASCDVTDEELAALTSQAAPIVLVCRRTDAPIAAGVAPGNPQLGAMLPYTPLHRLLLARVGRPVVCTSGNLSEEPMCTDNGEALARLGRIADAFLVHDRPIVRPVDDSVARIGPLGLELLRRARGFAPLPFPLGRANRPIVALGGHLKSTVAVAIGDQAIVSQHLGDLGSAEGALLLERTVTDLIHFYRVLPETVACDLHPEYGSTRLAERLAHTWGARLVRVQHHQAHVAACMAEHGLEGGVLGLAWDGTGWSDDGTIWGGEALLCDGARFERFSHLRPFSLVGGDLAIREPRRAAFGVLHAIGQTEQAPFFEPLELARFAKALATSSIPTTSMGRLFDAIAALAGLRGRIEFEGQAAMELEFCATTDEGAYPLPLDDANVADWGPMVRQVLDDRRRGVPAGRISARFHNALAELALAIAKRSGRRTVLLTGGCFQNRRLSRAVRARLECDGFDVRFPRLFPPNDGGISLGQLFVASRSCDPSHTPRAIGARAC